MPRLIASVGNQGTNRKNDVIVVQKLLNKHKIPWHPLLLKIDGIAGSKTIKQIIGFQKHKMNMRTPDGRVDPNGKTIAVLNQYKKTVYNSIKPASFIKPARSVDTVFLHCSASDSPEHDSVEVMNKWHKERGFSEIGYHFFIKKNGEIQEGRSLSKIPAAQKGYNKGTIAICLHGLKNFNTKQFQSLISLCNAIKNNYATPIRFRGHCEVSNKQCPVFNYKKVLNLNANGFMT